MAARVTDLQAPDKKMSTPGGTELGTVLVLDSPEAIRRKFKAAVIDSGRDIVQRQDKAGVTNLIQIMATARGIGPEQVEKEYAEAPSYAGFKQDVGEAVVELLAPSESATRNYGPTTGPWRECSPQAERRRGRSPRRPWSSCAGGWGSGPTGRPGQPGIASYG